MFDNKFFSTNILPVQPVCSDPHTLALEIAAMESRIRRNGGQLGGLGQTSPAVYHAFLASILEQEEIRSRRAEFAVDLDHQIRSRISLPPAETLSDIELRETLHAALYWISRFHVRLDSTNHLTDRQLYQLILDCVLKEDLLLDSNPVGTLWHHDLAPPEDLATDDGGPSRDGPRRQPDSQPVSSRDAWLGDLAESCRMRPLPDLL